MSISTKISKAFPHTETIPEGWGFWRCTRCEGSGEMENLPLHCKRCHGRGWEAMDADRLAAAKRNESTVDALTAKGLPVNELTVARVLHVSPVVDDQDGALEIEVEILDPEFATTESGEDLLQDEGARCACCGQRLRYACEVVHKPTRQSFFVGRNCAYNLDSLRGFVGAASRASVALAERQRCNINEQNFRATATPETLEAFDHARTASAPAVLKDLLAGARRRGTLSPNQVSLAVKIAKEDKERRAKGGACPVGRQQVTGKITGLKWRESTFGNTLKMTVDLGGGVRVWGTAPGVLTEENRGDSITFSATFEQSHDDAQFGFFKRPRILAGK